MSDLIVEEEKYYCWFCTKLIDKPENNKPAFCYDKCKNKYKKHRKEEKLRLKKLRTTE